MQDQETKALQEELSVYQNIEYKEELKKEVAKKRKQHKKDLPPTMKDRLEGIEAKAKSMGFTVDKSRMEKTK